MCWNGANPPARKMDAELVRRIEQQIAPSLSVLTPYDASEPLIAGWDITRRIAETYSIDLSLTTNGQFLDEETFMELEGITEALFLSLDSHIPEVYEKIRPRSKPDRVLANLKTAVALAHEHDVDFQVNIVLMTHNGPLLPETIAYLGRLGVPAVHVMQMLDVNSESGYANALVHFSDDYMKWLRKRCVLTAKAHDMFLVWDVMGVEQHDFRTRKIPPKATKLEYGNWDWRMQRLLPGYCKFVRDRLRITVDGSVAPCSYSTDGELELGNLADQDFEAMWNGAKAQDLRRAHLTWDYPTICKNCRWSDPPPVATDVGFCHDVLNAVWQDRLVERSLESIDPTHMTRCDEPPVIRIARPAANVGEYVLVVGLGGERRDFMSSVDPVAESDDTVQFEFPERVWKAMRPNVGYWWWMFASDADTGIPVSCSTEFRCVIRHRSIPRLADSGLRYPDAGHLPVVDLGSAKGRPEGTRLLPERPRLGKRQHRTVFDEPRRFTTSNLPIGKATRDHA
jgi:radical SAM protein with 4Fe4S-binding SPASM domain